MSKVDFIKFFVCVCFLPPFLFSFQVPFVKKIFLSLSYWLPFVSFTVFTSILHETNVKTPQRTKNVSVYVKPKETNRAT